MVKTILGSPKFRKATLLVVEVRVEDLEAAPAFVSQAVDLILANEGNVVKMFSSIVVATFDNSWDGEPLQDLPRKQERCEASARALQKTLDSNARILFGVTEAGFGANFGPPNLMNLPPFIRGFSSMREHLRNLSFGEIANFEDLPKNSGIE